MLSLPRLNGERFLSDLDDQFFDFHCDNPQVYDELVRLAREAKVAGQDRCGIRMLWEVMRWNLTIRTRTPDYKLNNSLHSRYARFIMACEPDLADMFAVRSLRNRDV